MTNGLIAPALPALACTPKSSLQPLPRRNLIDPGKVTTRFTSRTVNAVTHIRRMRGGAQSQLMRCDDHAYYVVKFLNNPQHVRILANEWLATRIAELIGLPVPPVAMVNVDKWLIENTSDLRLHISGGVYPFNPGMAFGSRYAVNPLFGQCFDYMPENQTHLIRNVRDFAGVLAFDKWLCNADGRQAAYWKTSREKKFTACFIDQGYCFNAGAWDFPDAPLRGVFGRNDVYAGISGWESFEPWLARIEGFPEHQLYSLAEEVPPEWYEHRSDALEKILQTLVRRRSRVRELILAFKNSSRNPFPAWK